MITRIAAISLAGLVVGALTVVAQQPPRDNAAATSIRIGTASVSGVVSLGDEARTPVRRAVVTMLSSDGVETRSTVSDDQGRFAIGGLPAGRYTLRAMKPAHLTMAYGARRPGRLGTSLALTDGQSMRDLRVSLPRGAVLAGRLTLENGEPLANTAVTAIPARLATAGGFSPAPPREFRTDDRGEFRIYGLMPDTYLVAALPPLGGREIQRRSDEEFDAIVRALQQPGTAQAGQRAAALPTDPIPAGAKIGYAPTYFPGTPIVGEAAPIAVRAGEVREGLGFTISRLPLATISGTVIGLNGEPVPTARVSVESEGPPLPRDVTAGFQPRTSTPNARGEFSIAGIPPGRYRVRAHAPGVITRDGERLPQTEWALTDVTVGGVDVSGVTLNLQPGRLFSGTLSAASPPASWSGAMVTLLPTMGNPGIVLNGLAATVATRQAPVSADGRFTVTGLVPYDYEMRVTLPTALAGWMVESIGQRGRDLRDAPLTFVDGSLEGVAIVLTTSVTELAGRLTSESGVPATDYFLVAFPEDRTLWHPASPRIRVVRPAVDGAFSIRDLPAGAYRLAMLADVEDDEPKRREFLESIYDTGVRVTVEAGRRTIQELRIK